MAALRRAQAKLKEMGIKLYKYSPPTTKPAKGGEPAPEPPAPAAKGGGAATKGAPPSSAPKATARPPAGAAERGAPAPKPATKKPRASKRGG